MIFEQSFLDSLIQAVEASHKYRDLKIPHTTLEDILAYESKHSHSRKELEANFRKSLHNIVAPYLEDINYPAETAALHELHDQNPSQETLKAWCLERMSQHASSCERLPYLEIFYQKIFITIGTPISILDLACALDPLGLPWMNLPLTTRFFAYDIHQPRLDFLQTFFQYFYPQAQAIHQDILTEVPGQKADCAFLFKEAHRLEKRRPGSNRELFASLNVKWLVVSLPGRDLAGHHSLEAYHTSLIQKAIEGRPWHLTTDMAGDELLFFIKKHD
jgi:16S rRNA (guanine(1405)-N(7))-methyltransferase